ncbi:MAG: hypothetical protein R3304_05620 [Longimicrobiales bacterium]|nr:hypothetical protein [Longimicrobiales bacterium]
MYLIREVMHCRPGQVRTLVDKFKALASVIEDMGYGSPRVYTDVSGERFWTLIFESEAESLDGFRQMEASVMESEDAREAMQGYHDLVVEGRREIYTIET